MSAAQRPTRYSSAGNSGYDDDFEADADELDAELDYAGQASDDEVAGADVTNASVHAGTADVSDDEQPRNNTNEHHSSPAYMQDCSPGHGELQSDRSPVAIAKAPASQLHGSTPQPTPLHGLGHPSYYLRDEVVVESPASPPPPLPPLNPTVSPYLARTSSQEDSAALTAVIAIAPAVAATASSLPSRLPPNYPAPSVNPDVGPRPCTSRGPGNPINAPPGVPVAIHSNATNTSPGTDAVPALALALLQQVSSQGVQQEQQRLAVAISQSVEALRTSEHVRQLQMAVEALTAQLVAAEQGRSTAEGALVELTQRMQEQEKRTNDSWASKLVEKQREVQQLRTKVQQLESQGVKGRLTAASIPANPRGSQHGVGIGSSISPEEAATLRKELEQTELLIRGYQQENEAATRRIKELEESLAAAESRAAEEVLRTERAALLGRDDVGRRNAETATKLARVLALEKELEGVREEAKIREGELKAQLAKLRAEKKALEARAGGVDLKAMAEGDVLVKELREEMDASRQANQALIQDMQAKLKWYAENQELLNKNDDLIAEQQKAIKQLQARLVQYEGSGGKGSAAHRVAAAQARVRELEGQVDHLNKALRSRAPGNSLAAVVAAARPSPEETQLVTELREQVEELEDKLKRKDEEFELQLRSYQQQFEKLKMQYSERACRLEAVSKARGRVKDLERQLEDQKNIFRRRVQELEARLKAAQDSGAEVPSTPAAAPQYQASALQTPTKGQQQTQQAPGTVASRRDDLVPASLLRYEAAREATVKDNHGVMA
ncbi:hypothetical protein Vretimale_16551 [Volvox reticuliferus]|uniref:Centrosomal protein of 162 kDa n=1 Tax=Volvox reticuliferus TaxID=1737510 RepID=A0A8J4CFZ0_9CHLO|nr:hypothetical protein Vretifemale_8741 [Volvox reticuliferus]GIM13413.1 hypothetical protein Vretimale_16551 [Volvox reticuliferus]